MARANFNIDTDVWIVFKAMCGKLKAVENGKERRATASDVLKELICEWIMQHEELLDTILEDMKKVGDTRIKIEEWQEHED